MFTHIFDVVCIKYKLSFVVNEGEREYDLKSKFQSYTIYMDATLAVALKVNLLYRL